MACEVSPDVIAPALRAGAAAPVAGSPSLDAVRPATSLLWPLGGGSAWEVEDATWLDLGFAALLPDGSGDRAMLAQAWRRVPTDPATVSRRQDVWEDLDRDGGWRAVDDFLATMDVVTSNVHLGRSRRHLPQRAAWLLSAEEALGDALRALVSALDELELRSEGLSAVRDHVATVLSRPDVRERRLLVERLVARVAQLRFQLRIQGDAVGVARDADTTDAAAGVRATFARFRQSDEPAVTHEPRAAEWFSSVEEAVIDRVVALHGPLFTELFDAMADVEPLVGPFVERLEGELRVLRAYHRLVEPLRAAGLPLCRPRLGSTGSLRAESTYDLALADRAVRAGTALVTNDVRLDPGERAIVITGPNQGGKTTMARTVGQLHLLAACGVPVPGRAVTLAVPDMVVTQFERAERVEDRRSMLEADLLRCAEMADLVTERSVVVLNEVFSSTAASDAVVLGERLLRRLLATGCVTVFVTFLDELSKLVPGAVVSMVSAVDVADPAERTLVVERRPADGRAYALALAGRYRLTREQLTSRLGDVR